MEQKQYSVIYGDPAWAYQSKHAGGNMKSGSIDKYPVMSTDDISVLEIDGRPVKEIAAKDCVLFLWCPPPLLKPDGFQVMEAWGFEYKTEAFVWVKLTSTGRKLFYGLGSYTRGNTEPCLLGVKGHPKRISKAVPQARATSS